MNLLTSITSTHPYQTLTQSEESGIDIQKLTGVYLHQLRLQNYFRRDKSTLPIDKVSIKPNFNYYSTIDIS